MRIPAESSTFEEDFADEEDAIHGGADRLRAAATELSSRTLFVQQSSGWDSTFWALVGTLSVVKTLPDYRKRVPRRLRRKLKLVTPGQI